MNQENGVGEDGFQNEHVSEPVVVEPLPFKDEPEVVDNGTYTSQLVADAEANENRGMTRVATNVIRAYLDEIDIAASVPNAHTRILHITKKIRNLL
jgi:hypothetical protein